jgi:hypothetical protein
MNTSPMGKDHPHDQVDKAEERNGSVFFMALLILCVTITGAWVIFLSWGTERLIHLL